jgi:hypothetical protein
MYSILFFVLCLLLINHYNWSIYYFILFDYILSFLYLIFNQLGALLCSNLYATHNNYTLKYKKKFKLASKINEYCFKHLLKTMNRSNLADKSNGAFHHNTVGFTRH